MKLDILAFGVHPDDVELACSGTLLHHIALGKSVGVVDLTMGQLGTRGSAELRLKEAKHSADIMGLKIRENLGMEDGYFENDRTHREMVIRMIRKYKPEIVLCNALSDRHPDHGRSGKLVSDSCYYSGLRKIETILEGRGQENWRPKSVYHYIQDHHKNPDFVVDISPYMDKKIEAIMAFSSQFFNPDSSEPATPISGKDFFEFVKARAREMGRSIGADFAEGFTVERAPGVQDLFLLD